MQEFDEVVFSGKHKNCPRVLALEGAGFVRIYSSLEILDDLVKEVSEAKGITGLKPCQFFDLICGTGFGGLVAIFLGRLQMSVNECRQALEKLESRLDNPNLLDHATSVTADGIGTAANVVSNFVGIVPGFPFIGDVASAIARPLIPPPVVDLYDNTVGRLMPDACRRRNSERIKEWLAEIMEDPRYGGSSTLFALAEEDTSQGRCKTFVLASPKENPARPHRIRAYNSRTDTKCGSYTIVEVGAAAAALALEFLPVRLGSTGIEYMDSGVVGYGNPSREALDETNRIWSTQPQCLVDIGVGGDSEPALRTLWNLLDLGMFISLDRNRVAQELFREASTMRMKYFRFNVEEIRSDALDWSRKPQILELTRNYLKDHSQRDLVKLCSELLVHEFRDGSPMEDLSGEMTFDKLTSSESPTVVGVQEPHIQTPNSQSRQSRTFDGELMFDTVDEPKEPDERAQRAASSWFECLRKQVHPVLRSAQSQSKNSKSIKIAVLDTGIQKNHPSFAKVNISGRISCRDFTGSDHQDISDNVGHGTHVADTILQVCPNNVELFIAKIVNSRHFTDATARHIADAILHAVNVWKVDIISMSLGFNERIPEIERAIRVAAAADILIFAAAANHGALNQVAFPARMFSVFAINSADGFGDKSAFTPWPRNNDDNFIVLGEAVKAAWPQSRIAHLSGTSHATPIAVGIAALLLGFYKGIAGEEDEVYKRLRTYEGMSCVFRRTMTVQALDRYTWLCPWKLFRVNKYRTHSYIQAEIASELNCL